MTIEAHTSAVATNRPPTLPRAVEGSRWLALDVFRALAVVWMIQGHTYTALLRRNDFLPGGYGQLYRMFHGLTAPMFLCGAGLSYGIVMFNERKPAAPGRIVRRALMLLGVGTLLQLPSLSLRAILERPDYQATLLRPSALQLVAACLLLAELLRAAAHYQRARFALWTSLFTLAVALVAPFVWSARISEQHVLGGWLDGQAGAQFPFVPWACFFLLGATMSGLWGSDLWSRRWLVPSVGAIGLCVSALCYWQYLEGERLNGIYGEHAFWYASPMFVSFRAGLVLAWLGVLSASSSWLHRLLHAWPSLSRLLRALSRHSLVAYVVHLVLLYGSPLSRGLRRYRPSYDVLECGVAFAIVLTVTVSFVVHWERIRELAGFGVRLMRRAVLPAAAWVRGANARH